MSRKPTDLTEKIGVYRAIVTPEFDSPELRSALAGIAHLLTRPGALVLQGGRNLTVHLDLPTVGPVAVKRFGRQKAWKDWADRRNDTKAARAYGVAAELAAKGIDTLPPVACLELWEGRRLVESYLITAYVAGLSSFKAELIALYERFGPCSELMELLDMVAVAIAGMHDAGIFHRDLGNQNLMLSEPDADGLRRIYVIDLNRARCRGGGLSLRERARDLSRIHLPSDFLRVFLEMYWRGEVPPSDFLRYETRYRRRYAWHTSTRRLRHPLRVVPPSPDGEYPPDRDLWIWDERSVQAIPPFRSRDRNRLRPPGRVTRTLRAVVLDGWRVWRRALKLEAGAFENEVSSIGERAAIALTARPDTIERELELLRELGSRRVVVRLYHHESREQQDDTLEIVGQLLEAGYDVALALIQDRRAVNDPAAWLEFGRRALQRVGEKMRWVEVGHAVNRVKWGIWGYRELTSLNEAVIVWQQEFPGVRFTGPAVIDFEPDFLMAALRSLPRGLRYAALSHHLYVDRRGPPEARQGLCDSVRKLAVLRAAAAVSGHCHEGLIISEFNWPLAGTGVWSPVGSPWESPGERTGDPSVDETRAALYMLRFLLLGLASGLTEEMVFWRLVARGFGLVDDSDEDTWRRRPGFTALKTWHAQLNGATFTGSSSQRGHIRLNFRTAAGTALEVAWCWPVCAAAEVPAVLLQAGEGVDAFGILLQDEQRLRKALATGIPVYFTGKEPERLTDGNRNR